MIRRAKDDPHWTIPKLLKAIRAACNRIEGHRLHVSKEEREHLLPLLIILKRLTKRKQPGFHEALASIGLNASTVRSWFYRGQHTDEIIAMLEPSPEPVEFKPTNRPKSDFAPQPERSELWEAYIYKNHLDKLAAAVLADKITLAKQLANEYIRQRDEIDHIAA